MMIELFQHTPWLWIATAGIFGLLVGSFLNVVIHRVPKMMQADWEEQAAQLRGEQPTERLRYNLFTPRSACPGCGHQIRASENVPVFGWLALRGKCSSCKAPISARYPIVELITGLLAAAAAWKFGPSIAAIAAIGLTFALVALTGIDLDTQLLPDDITLPLLWVGLLLNLFGVFTNLPSAVVGAVAGYLVLWLIFWAFKLLTGKEGMGYGDFKLLAALGAWFGWQALPVIILLSSMVGAVVGIALIVFKGKDRQTAIPFGPYLAGAGLLSLYFGPSLGRWISGAP
jgi:leader peptidase (prepilin peptidase) / N-methyltransferase